MHVGRTTVRRCRSQTGTPVSPPVSRPRDRNARRAGPSKQAGRTGVKRGAKRALRSSRASTTFAAPSASIHLKGPPRNGGNPIPNTAPMSPSRGDRTIPPSRASRRFVHEGQGAALLDFVGWKRRSSRVREERVNRLVNVALLAVCVVLVEAELSLSADAPRVDDGAHGLRRRHPLAERLMEDRARLRRRCRDPLRRAA